MSLEMKGGLDEPPSVKLLLLIEDDLTIASWLAELFTQQAGYQVVVASDCLTGLKFMRLCTPALMLLDERLLTSKGIDLGPWLSLMQDLQAIPFLLFSSRS
jgi:DNA-binding response OmpR family regulator